MSRVFLDDGNLPVALARMISSSGFSSEHISDIGQDRSADHDIWRRARKKGATIISKDIDFALLSRRHNAGPAVVWVRLGNVRNRVLLERMQNELPNIIDLLEKGERLIEVR